MEKTDAAVATVADKLGDKALQYLQSFEELAKQYSPDVVEAGLMVVRLNGAQIAITGLLCLIAVIVILWKVAPTVISEISKGMGGNPAIQIPGGLFGALAVLFLSISAMDKLTSIWTWVAIFEPKLYIAYKIFGKLF